MLVVFLSAFLLTNVGWVDHTDLKNTQVFEREVEGEDADGSYDTKVSIDNKINSSSGGDQYEDPAASVENHKNFNIFSLIQRNEYVSNKNQRPTPRVRLCILYCNLKIDLLS